MSSNVIIDDDLIGEIVNHIPSMSTKNRPIVIRSNRGSITILRDGDRVSYSYVADNGSYTGIGYEDDVLDRIRDLCIYISEGSDVSMGYTVPRVTRSNTSIPSSVSGGNPGNLLTHNVYDGNTSSGNTSNFGSSRIRGSTYGINPW